MKILFIYPDIVTQMMNFCPAVHVLSAVLKQEGHQTYLLHINNDNGIKYDRTTIICMSRGFDLFAVTSTSFNYKYANEIAGWLKEEYPNILSVLGGSHATTQPEDFNSSNFDIFCVGEGEEPMKDLVYALQVGRDWSRIPNFITRQRINPVRGFLKDLDKLPFWDFDITDTEKILELKNGWMSISFSRGCPYECTFCHNHLLKQIEIGRNDKMSDYIRRRNPAIVVEELRMLAERYKIKFFNTDDDLLTTNKEWLREYMELYREKIYEPFGIKYIVNARASSLDEEIVMMLADSGCKEVRIGFETGNEELRNGLLGKKTSNESMEKAFDLLNKYHVMPVAFMMMGVPGETWDTFYDTVNMTIRLRPKLIRMTFLYPYKHTRIYDYCVDGGLFKQKEIDDNRDMISPLLFDNLSDKELFLFRFLFPWYANERWFGSKKYHDAIYDYNHFSIEELMDKLPEIREKDKELSRICQHPHYRFYSGNDNYFELNDNLKDTIQD
jgi:anaerobic magnesium-protoporphyrin IX monomethyl ester cyclase